MHRQGTCAIGVMAKAPRPGQAKTRLCPPLRPAQAASLSAAFLRDITENIALAARTVPIEGCIAYAPAGDEDWFGGHLAEGTRLVLADGSPPMPPDVQGFGRCLLHATQARAAALGLDVVTLPTWYDVDDAASLDRLIAGADDGYAAPATNAWIERNGLRGRISFAAQ